MAAWLVCVFVRVFFGHQVSGGEVVAAAAAVARVMSLWVTEAATSGER